MPCQYLLLRTLFGRLLAVGGRIYASHADTAGFVHTFASHCFVVANSQVQVQGAAERTGGHTNTEGQPPMKRRRGSSASAWPGAFPAVRTCQATATLAEVIHSMAAGDCHHVFVVDPDSRPISAISTTDVLRVVLHAAGNTGVSEARSSEARSASITAALTSQQLPPAGDAAALAGASTDANTLDAAATGRARAADTAAAGAAPAATLPGTAAASRLESATSAQSGDRGASVCTSVQSEQGGVNSRMRPSR